MHQPGPWDGIPTLGVDAGASLLGDHGGGDDPAVVAVWGQSTGEPGPTGSRCRDEDQGCGCGWPRAHELITVAWPSAQGAQGDDLSVVICDDISPSPGVLVDIQPNIEWPRGMPG